MFGTQEEHRILGRAVRIYRAGEGPPLLLLHGGWGGAEAHWHTVMQPLSRRFSVYAPELPGVMEGHPFPSLSGYGSFLAMLVRQLGIVPAHVIGHSFGAALAAELAAREPTLVKRLVLVNGGPMGAPDPVSRAVIGLPRGRSLLRRMVVYNHWSTAAARRAFVDPDAAPSQIQRTLADPPRPLIELMIDFALRGESSSGPPACPTLVVWGLEDHLIGASPKTAHRIAKKIPGAKVAYIPEAGHLPQYEQPEKFVFVVGSFLEPDVAPTPPPPRYRPEERGLHAV